MPGGLRPIPELRHAGLSGWRHRIGSEKRRKVIRTKGIMPPYRSKRRDEQVERLLEVRREILQAKADMLFAGPSYIPPTLSPGAIVFSQRRGFTKMLITAMKFNKRELNKIYQKDFNALLECLDDLWIVISRYMLAVYQWAEARPNPMQEIMFSSLYKSLFSLYACHKLTSEGLFGLARPHLRHVFESLMIAKFCAVNPSADVYDKWSDGMEIYFANAVLKKIVWPQTDELTNLWKVLCTYSHATTSAGQQGLTIEETTEGTRLNVCLSALFMRWMYHLIYRHMVTPTVAHYGNYYAPNKEAENARVRLRKAFQSHKESFAPASLRLVKDFCASWRTK